MTHVRRRIGGSDQHSRLAGDKELDWKQIIFNSWRRRREIFLFGFMFSLVVKEEEERII